MPACSKPHLIAIVALLWTAQSQAAELAWPTPSQIERARKDQPFPTPQQLQRAPLPTLPLITPAQPSLDLADIARRHVQLKAQSENPPSIPALRIFVTLTMPEASLRRLSAQAEQAGASLTLRGLKSQSMKQTIDTVQRLIGERPVHWQIDPEAYTRYGVHQAPTFVLLKHATIRAPSQNCTTPCANSDGFVSVAGDVSVDYALDAMVRRHPDLAPHAAPYLKRLRPTP